MFRYSAIDTAHRCKQKYKLQWIDKVETKESEGLDLHFGTAMHGGLLASLEGDDPISAFNVYWKALQGRDVEMGNYSHAVLQEMGETFLSRFQRLHLKNFQPEFLEETLRGLIGTHPFEGTPDYIGKYKGVPSLVDWKTSNYPYTKHKIISNEQMPIYASLAEQVYKYKVEQLVYFVFIKSQLRIQILKVPVTQEFLDNILKNVILTCDDLVTRTQFPKSPSACVMGKFVCPYFEKCYGSLEKVE